VHKRRKKQALHLPPKDHIDRSADQVKADEFMMVEDEQEIAADRQGKHKSASNWS